MTRSLLGMVDSKQRRILIWTVIGSVALFLGIAAIGGQEDHVDTTLRTIAAEEKQQQDSRPSLDCAFYPFNHNSRYVYLYFDVEDIEGATATFYEREVAVGEGEHRSLEGDLRQRWKYAVNDDGNSTLTSSDGNTRILLYGLKLGAEGSRSIEAGIRNDVFLNLGGECRQSNLIRALH